MEPWASFPYLNSVGRESRFVRNSRNPVGVIILFSWSVVAVFIMLIARSILVGSTLSSGSGWIFDWMSWFFFCGVECLKILCADVQDV